MAGESFACSRTRLVMKIVRRDQKMLIDSKEKGKRGVLYVRVESSVIVKFHWGGDPEEAIVKPESKPPESCAQGAENSAWETLWFPLNSMLDG